LTGIDELVLCAAAPEPEADRLRKFAAGADWDATLAYAEAHGLAALLYRQLKQAEAAVPPEPLQRLQNAYRGCSVRSLVGAAELRKAFAVLNREGIEAVAFKGPTLAVMAYGDIGTRDFSDFDIYVPRHSVERAAAVLAENGYGSAFDPRVMRLAGSMEVELGNGRCHIDLHWEFLPKYFGTFNPDYRKLRRIPLEGFEAPAPAPEDLLVYMAADYTRDNWQSLSHVSDVAHLISRCRPDWDEVERRARECRLERMVLLAASLSSDLLHAAVPDKILKRCELDPQVASLAAKAKKRLQRTRFGPEGMDSAIFHLRSMDSAYLRTRYCLRRMFEPNTKDLGFIRLPAGAAGLYYLVRPLRLALMAASLGRIRN